MATPSSPGLSAADSAGTGILLSSPHQAKGLKQAKKAKGQGSAAEDAVGLSDKDTVIWD